MPVHCRLLVFSACLLVSLFTTRGSAEDAPFESSRFEITQLTSDLIQPMELAVAPDGTVFFIELSGILKAFNPVNHEVVLVGEIKITTEQENGLIGLTLDPTVPADRLPCLPLSATSVP